MAPEFVHKHIINKHASKMQDAKDKAYKDIFFDSYRHDPVRPRNPGAHNFGPMQAPPPHGKNAPAPVHILIDVVKDLAKVALVAKGSKVTDSDGAKVGSKAKAKALATMRC